jgi:hypothetical protein
MEIDCGIELLSDQFASHGPGTDDHHAAVRFAGKCKLGDTCDQERVDDACQDREEKQNFQ